MPREGGGQQRAGRASSAKWSWALSRWVRVWGRGGGLRACRQWTPLAALEEACHLLGMWDPSPAAVPPPGKWSFKGAVLTSLILPGDTVGPRCPGRPDSAPAQSWAPGGPRHPTSAAPATGMPAQGRGVGGAGQSGPSPGLLPVFLPGGPTDTSAGSTLLQAHNAPFTPAGLVEHGHLPGVPAGFWPCAQFGGRGPVTVNHQGGFST